MRFGDSSVVHAIQATGIFCVGPDKTSLEHHASDRKQGRDGRVSFVWHTCVKMATSGAHDYTSQPTLRLMPFVTITPLRSVSSHHIPLLCSHSLPTVHEAHSDGTQSHGNTHTHSNGEETDTASGRKREELEGKTWRNAKKRTEAKGNTGKRKGTTAKGERNGNVTRNAPHTNKNGTETNRNERTTRKQPDTSTDKDARRGRDHQRGEYRESCVQLLGWWLLFLILLLLPLLLFLLLPNHCTRPHLPKLPPPLPRASKLASNEPNRSRDLRPRSSPARNFKVLRQQVCCSLLRTQHHDRSHPKHAVEDTREIRSHCSFTTSSRGDRVGLPSIVPGINKSTTSRVVSRPPLTTPKLSTCCCCATHHVGSWHLQFSCVKKCFLSNFATVMASLMPLLVPISNCVIQSQFTALVNWWIYWSTSTTHSSFVITHGFHLCPHSLLHSLKYRASSGRGPCEEIGFSFLISTMMTRCGLFEHVGLSRLLLLPQGQRGT